jgi:hypothetical protein
LSRGRVDEDEDADCREEKDESDSAIDSLGVSERFKMGSGSVVNGAMVRVAVIAVGCGCRRIGEGIDGGIGG